MQEVVIKVKSRQTADGAEPQNIELCTVGKFTEKNGNYYIIYDEDAANGYEGSTTTLKVDKDGNKVIMTRGGRYKTRMHIETGERCYCKYNTEFGTLDLGIFTHYVKSSLGRGGGNLSFCYTIDINGGDGSKNTIEISVRGV